MTSLKRLSLASNRLELFETGVMSNLPRTLQIFSTAENKLTAGAYLLEFPSLPELKVYNMSFQLHPPKYFESEHLRNSSLIGVYRFTKIEDPLCTIQ